MNDLQEKLLAYQGNVARIRFTQWLNGETRLTTHTHEDLMRNAILLQIEKRVDEIANMPEMAAARDTMRRYGIIDRDAQMVSRELFLLAPRLSNWMKPSSIATMTLTRRYSAEEIDGIDKLEAARIYHEAFEEILELSTADATCSTNYSGSAFFLRWHYARWYCIDSQTLYREFGALDDEPLHAVVDLVGASDTTDSSIVIDAEVLFRLPPDHVNALDAAGAIVRETSSYSSVSVQCRL